MLESFDQMALINTGRLIEQMDLIIDAINQLERRLVTLELAHEVAANPDPEDRPCPT